MKSKKYTKGFEDMERVLEHLNNEFKKHQKEEWLRQHFSQRKKLPNKPGGTNESNGESRRTSV